MSNTDLNERSAQLLNSLVARYIREGVPVGSKALSQSLSTVAGVSLSPASIRNIMSELEEAGYIRSPHTSAGRVPTDLAYRLFVDSVVTAGEGVTDGTADQPLIAQIKQEFSGVANLLPEKLAESASGLLSHITHQAGLVMLPRAASISFRQLEFLPLSERRVLVILVLNEQEVQNRVIQVERDYSEAELQQAAAYINQNYSGRDVDEVRSVLVGSMEADKSAIDQLMQATIDMASKALDGIESSAGDYVVAGQANLLDQKLDDMARLRELFEAFQQKKDILHLMERCVDGEGVQIYIGEESGFDVLDDFSIVTAPYETQGQRVGVLGVIGPTRMAYERVIPMVDITAKLLSATLNPK